MGMMAKMRSLAPWFIIAVGGLFVLFMVLSDTKLTNIAAQRSNNVGSINGEDISYQEFSSLVENYRTQQVAQTGKEIPEEQMDFFREQVWEQLVSQKLVQEKIKELGIVVTNEEIINTIKGPNPPEIITQYFKDSTGQFNRAAYDQAILDPSNKEAMLQTEELVRQQLIQKKLATFLNASVIVSDAEIKRKFIEQNIKMTADYILVEANQLPDSQFTVTDEEAHEYYDENLSDYKVDEQRKIKYVLFNTAPTHDDSSAIKYNLEKIVEKLQEDTASFKTYVEIYSDKEYSVDTTTLNLLPSKIGSRLIEAKEGQIIGPELTNEGYVVYKLNKTLKDKNTLVRASHILIKFGKDEKATKSKIDSLYKELLNGASFEQIARENSEDGTAKRGGDLGWFGKGQMVKEFENAAFNGRIGKIQKPFKTQFGYHIVKVTGKSNKKFVVEKIVNEIKASATTIDRAYNRAEDFAYIADKNDFDKEAELMKYKIIESLPFTAKARAIPGLGSNNALLRFTFDNSIGDVSKVFKVPTGYVVATVSDISPKGYKPFEEVVESIKRIVQRNKKIEKTFEIASEIKEKVADGNFGNARSIFPKAKISKAADFTASGTIPGIGRDYAFAQAALKAELNKVVGPVKANRGSYLLKITQRTELDSTLYSIQKNSIRNSILTELRNRVYTDWIAQLKENADIEDNRYKFYR